MNVYANVHPKTSRGVAQRLLDYAADKRRNGDTASAERLIDQAREVRFDIAAGWRCGTLPR